MKPLKVKDAAEFGKVAVLMGGAAAEREISLNSGREVYQALLNKGVDAVAVDVKDRLIETLQQQKFDRVFNIIHGRGGEDGVLQSVLQVMGIPYTGSKVLASALAMDKVRTKQCWQGMGLPTPPWMVLRHESQLDDCIAALGFPMIVKPSLEGSSLGMNKAENREQLISAFREAAEFDCDVYAEKWLNGREYTVAVLDGEALPVIGLETPNAFYDYQAKYQAETTQYHCPCDLSDEREKQMQSLALAAVEGVCVSGWGRVDAFIDEFDEMQLIEVNTVPGMTDHSLVPMAAKAIGISFDELVWRILETSL